MVSWENDYGSITVTVKIHHSLSGQQLQPFNIMKAKWDEWLTLCSQQIGIEAQEVCAEVEPPLAGHFAFPVAARVVRDKLFRWRELKPLLKPQQGFSELFRIILQHQWCFPLLSNETLADQQTQRLSTDRPKSIQLIYKKKHQRVI